MNTKKVKSYCRSCGSETNHTILSEHNESHREEYACDYAYQVTECMGCETKAFRSIFRDLESAYQVDENEWEIPTSIDVYPKFIKGHRSLNTDFCLPPVVGRIYNEVLVAIQEEALILAGLGLRGAIEAVCNDLNIRGKNLEIRISKLANAGNISQKDAARLHGIRFLGNDAAHEIKKPKKEQLSVALKIVEHLLSSVYILDEESDGRLDITISEFSKFEPLLKKRCSLLNSGDELPLEAILGKDIRRIKDTIVALEAELLTKIASRKISYIAAGKVAVFQGSKNALQHYIVQAS